MLTRAMSVPLLVSFDSDYKRCFFVKSTVKSPTILYLSLESWIEDIYVDYILPSLSWTKLLWQAINDQLGTGTVNGNQTV